MKDNDTNIVNAQPSAITTKKKGLRTYKDDVAKARGGEVGAPNAPIPPPTKEKIRITLERETEQRATAEQKARATKPTLAEEVVEIRRRQKEDDEAVRAQQAKKEEVKTRDEREQKIAEEKTALESDMGQLIQEETLVQKENEVLIAQRAQAEETLRPTLEKEKLVEEKIASMEKEEGAATDADARRMIEQKRWEAEEERRNTEKEKWVIQEKVEEIVRQMEEKGAALAQVKEKKVGASAKIKELEKEKGKIELGHVLEEVTAAKEEAELKWIELNDKKEALVKIITPVIEQEKILEKEKLAIEGEESAAADAQMEREAEEKRWGVENKRKETEEKRWGLEKELAGIEREIEILKPEYQEALAREEEVQKKLAALE